MNYYEVGRIPLQKNLVLESCFFPPAQLVILKNLYTTAVVLRLKIFSTR